MLPKKTALAAAGTMVMVIITITTAIALNIGLLRSAQSADSGTPSAEVSTFPEPQVRTVVVEVPGEGAPTAEMVDQSLGAPVPTGAAPSPTPAVRSAAAAPTPQATQAPTTQAPTTQAPTTQAPTTQAPTTQPPATQAPTTQAVVQTEYLTFPMGNIGDVVVANHGGKSLEFWSAYPTGGWRFMVEETTGDEIEIEFEKDGAEAEMKVKLEDGRISVEREGI
ncbi:MAG: hypothetical protein GY713_03800 [Actinomycetia bacterium]|nr:hypothetical protein [Actinomycetes bacterium]